MTYILLGNGFEEVEALVPADLLRRAEIEVKLVSAYPVPMVRGSHGITVIADATVCSISAYPLPDALILPGGMGGVNEMRDSEPAQKLIRDCCEADKLIGAICAAPTRLSEMGLIRGRGVTCFPDLKDRITDGIWIDSDAVTDGKLVTSRAAGTAAQFSFSLIRALKDQETADRIKRSIWF